jgi:hypothetical protein
LKTAFKDLPLVFNGYSIQRCYSAKQRGWSSGIDDDVADGETSD